MQLENATRFDWDADCCYAAIIDGDHLAWATLIEATHRFMLKVLVAGGAGGEAEEIVQLTYTKAWEKRGQFSRQTCQPVAVTNWLMQIAVNAHRDAWRVRSYTGQAGKPRANSTPHCDLTNDQAYAYLSAPATDWVPGADLIREEERAEAHATLARLVATLPPVWLRYLPYLLDDRRGLYHDGMTVIDYDLAVQETGLSHSGVKSACHRVRQGLRHAARLERLLGVP